MQWHNSPCMHRTACHTTHACCHKIRHTPLHAVACRDICRYTCCIRHRGMHAVAKFATQACMHCMICHRGRHAATCSCTFYYTCSTCHTSMNAFAQSVKEVCLQSHILLRKLYLLHSHACRRTICHTNCSWHACSPPSPTQVGSARQAGMQWHNVPHKHHMVCHTRMHAVT